MGQSCTILCVDDEPSVLTTLKALLESAGFRVLAAESGPEALALFQSEAVDLVIMDYVMPGMNGMAAARTMKTIKPLVPIVFLSAFRELPDETLGLAEWWVMKGEHEPESLLERLRRTIQRAA
jgi:CheY-like chemotaxis protein